MLKARDALRAKTANVAEEKWKQKTAAERGDRTVARELRQKMFEQQRQYVFREHSCLSYKLYQ